MLKCNNFSLIIKENPRVNIFTYISRRFILSLKSDIFDTKKIIEYVAVDYTY